MMKDMETGKCFGQMEACMKENGVKESNMESVELFFQMEHTKKVTLKTMCTNILSNQVAVSMHK